jgi:hypothetical protein
MKMAISTAFIITVAILLVASLLEVFLDEIQKDKINSFTVRLWNLLDELKARRLLDWLQARQRWLVGAGVFLTALLVLWAIRGKYQRTGSLEIGDIVIAVIIFAPGIWFGWTIAGWILRARTLFWAVTRATLSIVVVALPLLLLAEIEKIVVLPMISSIAIPDPTLGIALLQLLILTCTGASVFFTAIGLLFLCPVGIPLGLIYIASVLIFVGEFVVARIAEYPRGILAAMIVILAALAAFLKAIG